MMKRVLVIFVAALSMSVSSMAAVGDVSARVVNPPVQIGKSIEISVSIDIGANSIGGLAIDLEFSKEYLSLPESIQDPATFRWSHGNELSPGEDISSAMEPNFNLFYDPAAVPTRIQQSRELGGGAWNFAPKTTIEVFRVYFDPPQDTGTTQLTVKVRTLANNVGVPIATPAPMNMPITIQENTIQVPDVRGMTRSAAEDALQAEGLVVAIAEACSNTVASGNVISQNPQAGVEVAPGHTVTVVVSTGTCPVDTVTVPRVTGMTRSAAEAALQKEGLVVKIEEACSNTVASGNVISQDPQAGAEVAPGHTVTVLVSTGTCPVDTVTVPPVTGMTRSAAEAALQAEGLVVRIEEACSNTVPSGNVISQDPQAGAEVALGHTVTVLVSTGTCPIDTVAVPRVTGMTRSAAEAALQKEGLVVEIEEACSNTVAAGNVISQDPQAGTEVAPGHTVTVLVSTGFCPDEGENIEGEISQTLCESVDNCDVDWITYGDAPWFSQSAVSYIGASAIQSGAVDDDESSSVETSFWGPAIVSFFWKVSSESGSDYLYFDVNGIIYDGISGETDWEYREYTLPDGYNTLQWSYSKDGSIAQSNDCGWLDGLYVQYGSEGEAPWEGESPEGEALGEEGETVSLVVTPSNQNVSASSGTAAFTIQTTTTWSVSSNASWLTVAPNTGAGNAVLTASFTSNLEAKRTAILVVTGMGANPASVTVTVTQNAGTSEQEGEKIHEGEKPEEREGESTVPAGGSGCGCRSSKSLTIENSIEAIRRLLGDWMLVGLSLMVVLVMANVGRGR